MATLTGHLQRYMSLADGTMVGIHKVVLPDTGTNSIAIPPLVSESSPLSACSDQNVTIAVNPSNNRLLDISGGSAGQEVTVLTLHKGVGSFDPGP